MIRAYPDRSSVLPGRTLTLHVSTDKPLFRVEFFRQGQTLDKKATSAWMPGQDVANKPVDQDWEWPSYDFEIGEDWPSGAYVAVLTEGDEQGNRITTPDLSTADGRDARALFVVRSSTPGSSASILYKLSTSTFHAYNFAGGASIYEDPPESSVPPGHKVTLHRPGGGTGAEVPGGAQHADYYDPESPPQTFQHWDVPLICWLEANRYQVDYCTDLDIHTDFNFLRHYSLLISTGHDEYWSEEMRHHVEKFIEDGGNVAFFSGNTCFWRIHYVDNNTALVTDKSGPAGTAGDQWWAPNGAADPEDSLTGVSYRNAGGQWSGQRESVGYRVQHADHWLFEATGLKNGDFIGKDSIPPLVGYECDGALLRDTPDAEGFAVPAYKHGTPATFIALGIGRFSTHWQDEPPREDFDAFQGIHAATMGVYRNNGTVFTAATTDWAKVLASGGDPSVDRITHNILNRLGG